MIISASVLNLSSVFSTLSVYRVWGTTHTYTHSRIRAATYTLQPQSAHRTRHEKGRTNPKSQRKKRQQRGAAHVIVCMDMVNLCMTCVYFRCVSFGWDFILSLSICFDKVCARARSILFRSLFLASSHIHRHRRTVYSR